MRTSDLPLQLKSSVKRSASSLLSFTKS
jgi:hypothetical protein